jgi:hypothetical protein
VDDRPAATIEGLRRLAALVPRLEAPGASLGAWEPMTQGADGVWSMPFVIESELAEELRLAIGEAGLLRPDLDWQAWLGTERGDALRRNPALVAGATFEELGALATSIIRGERFSEGNLLGAFERGHVTALARRAGVLADDPPA